MEKEDRLKLGALLSESWRADLLPVLYAQPDIEKFLGEKREWTIPERSNTFSALNSCKPSDVKVVIFGQDPYPRTESANGIAFWDGAVTSWQKPMSPSLRNIVKNLLISRKHAGADTAVAQLRKNITKIKLMEPTEWFPHTLSQGVLWLNTALTFSSTDTKVLKQHTTFWRPVIAGILRAVFKNVETGNGVVFVMWGGHAQKLKPLVEKARDGTFVEYVFAPHPAVQNFHSVDSFTKIDEALANVRKKESLIDWIGNNSDSDSNSSPPASLQQDKVVRKRNSQEKESPSKKRAKNQ